MNKTQLIDAVAARSQRPKTDTAALLEAVIDVVEETLASGEPVQLVGFGSFSVIERAAREGRNPATGETLAIPAKKIVKFKAGKTLAVAVAGRTPLIQLNQPA
jgi:DNA-binding protein HU-beta